MDAVSLLLLSVSLFAIGALASLLLNAFGRVARLTSGLMGAAASGVGGWAVVQAIAYPPPALQLADPFHFGHFVVQMDGLSTLMAGMITLLSLAVSVYSIAYWEHYPQRNAGVAGFFTNLFVGLMLLVVTVTNAFYFLIVWEMMTLVSYCLVIFESEKKEAVEAGYLYMLVAHAGAVLIMLAFFIFYWNVGSFDFAAFRQNSLSSGARTLIFLLAFIGFGAKAGVAPLHIWLPRAHPAAPSPASALLSGVMIKTAIYGLLRFGVDLLGAPVLWWGLLVLVFGALSAGLGVFYALVERDLKRLLAYSSLENVGIILLGIGAGMIGLATAQPTVALLGFLAALYHALNHSAFKGLLFLGAGAIDYSAHTRNLNALGGLGQRMPWTGGLFFIGALAVAALPPFNGFISEWLTYQALFAGSGNHAFIVRAFLPLCAVLLALVGAVAAMVAVKMYGAAFIGPARSESARQASEAPSAMRAGMSILALSCLALAFGAPWIAPYLAGVVASTFNIPLIAVAEAGWVYPGPAALTALSPLLIAALLLGLAIVPVILVAMYRGYAAGRRAVADPWACGYGYSSAMSVSASSFDQPVTSTFSGVYRARVWAQQPLKAIAGWAERARPFIARAEPVLESLIRQPAARAVTYLGQRIQVLQMGDIRMYCLYIVFTLVVLLVVIFR